MLVEMCVFSWGDVTKEKLPNEFEAVQNITRWDGTEGLEAVRVLAMQN